MRARGAPILTNPGAHGASRFFPEIRVHLERMAAGSRRRYTRVDIERAIVRGAMQLWLIREREVDTLACVFLTEIVDYPRRRALRFVACVGHDWRGWRHLQAQVRDWARMQGCDLVEAFAPAKWQVVFPSLKVHHVMFEGPL